MRKLLAALVLLPMLVSCSEHGPESSSATPAQDDGMTQVDPVDVPDDMLGKPHARISADEIEVVLYGSSSCPPTPDRVAVEGTTLKVVLNDNAYSGQACTADYGPTTWKTDSPNGVENVTTGEVVYPESGTSDPLPLIHEQ